MLAWAGASYTRPGYRPPYRSQCPFAEDCLTQRRPGNPATNVALLLVVHLVGLDAMATPCGSSPPTGRCGWMTA